MECDKISNQYIDILKFDEVMDFYDEHSKSAVEDEGIDFNIDEESVIFGRWFDSFI